jgi:hypothetical protein
MAGPVACPAQVCHVHRSLEPRDTYPLRAHVTDMCRIVELIRYAIGQDRPRQELGGDQGSPDREQASDLIGVDAGRP